MKTILLLTLAVSVGFGCKKKDAAEPTMDEAAETAAKADEMVAKDGKAMDKKAMGEKAMDEKAMADKAAGDYIKVTAMHEPKKPEDPVVVEFKNFSVTEMDFDPKKLVGGKATLEIELASLSSGNGDRDGHLKNPDFLDVAKMPKAIVKVSVDKKNGKKYMGTAHVEAHGMKAKWPVSFEIVKEMDDGVVIKASHSFKRSDLKVGSPPSKDLPVADKLTLDLQLTLQNT